MLIVLGCVLVAGALWSTARFRVWQSIAASILTAGLGIACIMIAMRTKPPPFDNRDVEYLCNAISSELEDLAFFATFEHPRAPRPVSEWIRGRRAAVLSLLHGATETCVETPETCRSIVETADPAAQDFDWSLNYVSRKMRRHGRCEFPIPPAPRDPASGRLAVPPE